MSNIWLFVLLVVAVALGWIMGRIGRSTSGHIAEDKFTQELPQGLPKSYYFRGLNYLINEQPDGAIDAFVAALEVNSETLETHIALGNLLRRRGEVDRAIRVHQNLLARPSLDKSQLHQAQLELAKDYIAAGLLDRAERLLVDLADVSAELKAVCLKHLTEIYRDEREWKKAIAAASILNGNFNSKLLSTGKRRSEFNVPLSHFCCEIADEALKIEDYREVRKQVREALYYDKSCVRANLLLSKLEYDQGHYAEAIKILSRIPQQNPDFIPESIDLIVKCYSELGDTEALKKYLESCLDAHHGMALLLPITDKLKQEEGEQKAASFLADQLKKQPSIQGVSHYLDLQLQTTDGEQKQTLTLLKEMIDKLLLKRPKYRCKRCGFSGTQLHWLCPSCKEWGEVRAIEGE